MHISNTLTQDGTCDTNPSDQTCPDTYRPLGAWEELSDDRLNADTVTDQSLEYSPIFDGTDKNERVMLNEVPKI